MQQSSKKRKSWNTSDSDQQGQHLDDAVAALSIQLTPDEIKHMGETYVPHTVRGHS
jgi:hypothetical protein